MKYTSTTQCRGNSSSLQLMLLVSLLVVSFSTAELRNATDPDDGLPGLQYNTECSQADVDKMYAACVEEGQYHWYEDQRRVDSLAVKFGAKEQKVNETLWMQGCRTASVVDCDSVDNWENCRGCYTDATKHLNKCNWLWAGSQEGCQFGKTLRWETSTPSWEPSTPTVDCPCLDADACSPSASSTTGCVWASIRTALAAMTDTLSVDKPAPQCHCTRAQDGRCTGLNPSTQTRILSSAEVQAGLSQLRSNKGLVAGSPTGAGTCGASRLDDSAMQTDTSSMPWYYKALYGIISIMCFALLVYCAYKGWLQTICSCFWQCVCQSEADRLAAIQKKQSYQPQP